MAKTKKIEGNDITGLLLILTLIYTVVFFFLVYSTMGMYGVRLFLTLFGFKF